MNWTDVGFEYGNSFSSTSWPINGVADIGFVAGNDGFVVPEAEDLDFYTRAPSWDEQLFQQILASPFPAIIVQLSSGYVTKRCQWLSRGHADILRPLFYKWLMSLFLFRHIWRVQFEPALYMVGIFSSMFYSLWFCLSLVVAKKLEPSRNRAQGLVMIATQGHMLAFAYPLLAEAPYFGDKALACAVMWDLGGNMWVCSAILWAVAAHAEGKALAAKEHLNFDNRFVRKTGLVSTSLDDATQDQELLEDGGTKALAIDSTVSPLLNAVKAVLCSPMFHAAIVGLSLNSSGVIMPEILDSTIELIGRPIKPAVYFLLGFYAEFNLDRRDKAQFALVIGARILLQAFVASLAWVLPLQALYRKTICIAVFSPASSVVVQIVSENSWGDQFMRVSVAAFLASAIFGIGMQHFLVATLGPIDWLE